MELSIVSLLLSFSRPGLPPTLLSLQCQECEVCRTPRPELVVSGWWKRQTTAGSSAQGSPSRQPCCITTFPHQSLFQPNLGWAAHGKSCASVLRDTWYPAPIFLPHPRNWGPLGRDDEDRTEDDRPARSSSWRSCVCGKRLAWCPC